VSTTSVLKMSNTIHEDYEDINTDISGLIAKLKKPLFKVQSKDIKYGVTINIQPTRHINKRQWCKYTPAQQTSILTRMEASIRRTTPSIKLIELHFETCPIVKNIHFHALYEMPQEFIHELECQWNRLVGTIVNKHTSTDKHTVWRHLDIKEIYGGEDEWLKYIRKDAMKSK